MKASKTKTIEDCILYIPIPKAERIPGELHDTLALSRTLIGRYNCHNIADNYEESSASNNPTYAFWSSQGSVSQPFLKSLNGPFSKDSEKLPFLLIQSEESLELLIKNKAVKQKIENGRLPVIAVGREVEDYIRAYIENENLKIEYIVPEAGQVPDKNDILKAMIRLRATEIKPLAAKDKSNLRPSDNWLKGQHSKFRNLSLIAATLPALFTGLALGYGIPEAMAGAAMSGKVIAFIVVASILACLLFAFPVRYSIKTGCLLDYEKRTKKLNNRPGIYASVPTTEETATTQQQQQQQQQQ